MYAVVEIGGMQSKVSETDILRVPKIDEEPNASIVLDRLLLIVDKENINVGNPFVPNARISATVISHGQAEKIKVFKKKRRKNYRVLKGHRQEYTELRIDQISMGKDEKKKDAAPQETEVKESAEPTEVKTKKIVEKKKVEKKVKPESATAKKGTMKAKVSAKPRPTKSSESTEPKAKKTASKKKED